MAAAGTASTSVQPALSSVMPMRAGSWRRTRERNLEILIDMTHSFDWCHSYTNNCRAASVVSIPAGALLADLDAAVLRAPARRVVRRHGLRRADAFRRQAVGRDSRLHEVRLDRCRPLLGELPVVIGGADTIRVPFDRELPGRLRLRGRHDLVERALRFVLDVIGVGVERDPVEADAALAAQRGGDITTGARLGVELVVRAHAARLRRERAFPLPV